MTNKNVFCVVASGNNVRLLEYTGNIIPKCLLPVYTSTGILPNLVNTVNMNPGYTDYAVIVKPEFVYITKKVLEYYKLPNVKVFSADPVSSAFAIDKNHKEFEGANVTFCWSDLKFDQVLPIDFFDNYKTAMVVTRPKEVNFSYGLTDDYVLTKEVQPEMMQIPGIYHIKGFSSSLIKDSSIDFVNVFADLKFTALLFEEFVDIGDKEKYKHYVEKNKVGTRTFNSIIFTEDGTVVKTSSDTTKITLEREWLQLAKDLFTEVNCPEVIAYSESGYEMEKIEGQPLIEVFNSIKDDKKQQARIVQNVLSALSDFTFNSPKILVKKKEFIASVEKETTIKLNSRLNSVKTLIDSLGSRYGELIDCSNTVSNEIKSYYEMTSLEEVQLSFFHGDLNFSNIFIGPSGQVSFIDPRAKFGEIEKYGPYDYEFSKILYGFIGYDNFNNTVPHIKGTKFEAVTHELISKAVFDNSPRILKLWLIVHVLGLIPLVSHDLIKLEALIEFSLDLHYSII